MKTLILLFSLISTLSFAQDPSFTETEIRVSKWIDGSLIVPNSGSDQMAIIIGGSGPTDRNGNQNFAKTNNLKKLAETLAENGIASFRYDKRIVKQIKMRSVDPNIKFDDFVSDAIAVVHHFKSEQKFKQLYIIGHSQGSLIGMLAAQQDVDGLISIAGAGQSIDAVIIDQVDKTAPLFTEETKRAFEVLKSGRTTTDYPPALASIFDSSVQKFMMSWMKHDPAVVIKSLNIPILLLNGTKDLQVSKAEAEMLQQASETSELKLIDNMNHVLFVIDGDDQENAKSYNDPNGKVSEVLIQSIVNFIKQ
ncbi:lysophospholipase [Gelidibacter salicanalis]|uniref:Lysophospholipase n=1 Tax=Gelidibacter salicanalis TaxID=291193 RepID=A0A5C7AM12_9FLAO|nr:alpha/beta hydrolase [Gelidibacter salicanalis]TXE09437.1 lysophospholipase [Gelidibacter salicanalis]